MTLSSPLPLLSATKAGLSKGRDPPAKEPSFAPAHPGGQAPRCPWWGTPSSSCDVTWPFQPYLQHCPGREIPPYGENIISFPACFQMSIIFLFSLHESFQRDTSSFGKSAVTQNLLVLSPMQVKLPKKHDNYHKLMPYTSSPIPCVYVVNLKCRLLTVGTSFCLSICTTSKGAGRCWHPVTSCKRWIYVAASSHVEQHLLLPQGCAAAPHLSPSTHEPAIQTQQ